MAVTIGGADAQKTVDDARVLEERKRRVVRLDPRIGPEDVMSYDEAMSLHIWNLTAAQPRNIPQQLNNKFSPTIEFDTAAEIGQVMGTSVEQSIRDARARVNLGTYEGLKSPAQKRHEDEFLLAYEAAWHNTRGRIDPMFYIMNSEDIHLLGMDAEATERLAGTERLWIAMDKATAARDFAQSARIDVVMANYNVGREKAAELLVKYDAALQQGDQAVAAMTDVEILKYAGYKTASEMGVGFAADDAAEEERRAQYLARGKGQIWNEAVATFAKDTLPQGYQGRDFHNIMMGKDYTPAGLAKMGVESAFGVVGAAINGMVNVSGWLLEAGGVTMDGAAFQRGFEMLFGGSDTVEAMHAREDWLATESGRAHEEIVAQFAAEGLLNGWELMKREAPDEAALYINMAGGKESVARAMWSEDAQYQGIVMEDGQETNIREMAEAQAKLYEDELRYNLDQLEDENFGVSDALLNLLAIWGEGVENLATVATLGAKQLWDDGADLLFTGGINRPKKSWSLKQLYKDVQKADTPAGALGIEGTLTGLAFNLGSMALMDPMTWIFGPRLARAGRAGVFSAEQATAVIESRVQDISRQQMIDVARSSTRGATAFSTLLHTYGETGLASRMMGAMRGFKNPLTTFWKGMEKWGKAADDIYVPTLRGMMPKGASYTNDVLEAAYKRMQAGEHAPVVVEYNPSSGARQVVEGGEYVAAAEKYGVDSLQTTMRRNEAFGTFYPPATFKEMRDAVKEYVGMTPEGTMTPNQLADYLELDYRSPHASASQRTNLDRMKDAMGDTPDTALEFLDEVESIPIAGDVLYDKVELTFFGPERTVMVTDGNTRVAAMIEKGFGDTPINVDFVPSTKGMDGMTKLVEKRPAAPPRHVIPEEIGRLPDPDVGTGEWVNRAGDGRIVTIDGIDYVSPRNIMPDEIRWGDDIDIEAIKKIEFEHLMRGGDPMNANRTAMSVSMGAAFRDTLAASGVGRRIESFFTSVNNNLLLSHTGPTGMSNTANVLSRIFGSVDDMEGLELANRRIMNWWNEHGQLTRQSDELTAQSAALQAQMDGIEQAMGGSRYASQMDLMDPTTQYYELANPNEAQLNLFQSIDRLKPEQGPVPPGTETVQQVGRQADPSVTSMELQKPANYEPGTEPVLPQENLFQAEQPVPGSSRPIDTPYHNPEGITTSQLVDDGTGHMRKIELDKPDPATFGKSDYKAVDYPALPDITREISQSLTSAAERNRPVESALRIEIRALDKQLTEIRRQQQVVAAGLKNFDGLNAILDDVFDEFVQKHIASNPAFKELLDEEGRIDPTKVSTRSSTPLGMAERSLTRARADGIKLGQATMKELGYIPEFMKSIIDVVDEGQFDMLMQFLEEVNHGGKSSGGYAMSMSPLELMAAANGTPQVMRQLGRAQWNTQLRQFAHLAQNYWMIDKVLTPRTAIVVTLDELMRAWHTGGIYSAFQYFEDKIMNATRLVDRQMQLPGFQKLELRWQQRIQALQEYPDFFKQMQGSILDNKGYGFDTIPFRKNHPNYEYYAAAQETAQQRISSPGWQNYFKGRESFREWFETSTEAELLRSSDYWDTSANLRKAGLKWEEVYQGYETLYELSTKNVKAGKEGAAREAWAAAAENAATSEKAVTLPNWVLEGFGEVHGAAKIPSATMPRPVEWVSDALFQRPMNYRQGFLAELVRKSEMARLETLFKSQGAKIVTDEEILSLLRNKYPGLHERFLREGIDGIAMELMDTEHIISQRAVRRMVESKVVAEMENQLYGFHMQSAAGRKARAVMPFGKPWADMWGFWGREMLGRPQLRGLLNSENYGKLSQIANAAADRPWVNPKTTAFISRLAATDFSMDNIGDDPLFGGAARFLGIDRMDVGNALFLPTGGESPWLVLLPGLGAIPGAMVESALLKIAPDPLEDPTGYQMFTDQWGKVFPGIGYNRQTSLTGLTKEAAVGGGVIGRGLAMFDNLGMITGSDINLSANSITADWKMGMAYDREVKLAFTEPKIWAELAGLPPDQATIALEAYINDVLQGVQKDAARSVGWDLAKEGMMELMAPARINTLTQRDDLRDVWLDGLNFFDVTPEFKNRLNLDTEKGRDEAADAISSWFFGLAPDEKDNYIAAHPELAVNTISMWTWSDHAIANQIQGSGIPYRSGGSTEERNRHETLIEEGYLRVLTPRELAVRIIGTVYTAKSGTARRVYEQAAKAVNDQRWAELPPDYLTWFESLRSQLKDVAEVPWDDPRMLWENFDKVRDIVWEVNGRPMKDVKKDGKVVGEEPDKISLPQKRAPWGETLPSDFSSLRDDYENGYPVPTVTPELAKAAAAAGIDVTAGMEMSGIYQAVANVRSALLTDNPVFSIVGPEYLAYLSPRSAGHEDVIAKLNTALDAEGVDEDTRHEYRKIFIYLEDAIERRHAGDQSWLQVRDQAATLYKGLKSDDIMGKLPLDFYWNQAYGSQLGALDWTPDEPAPLFQDDGTFNPEAQRILVRKVYDGDTIQFSTGMNDRLFGALGGPKIPSKVYSVRLLGVNAREMGQEGGDEDRLRLSDKIEEAIDNGVPIYLVKDPKRYGYTDFYGRLFGWVYIGDEAFSIPETQYPTR